MQSFKNLSLSFRGAERQAPTVLQMALRFSKVMDRQSDTQHGNTESRLKKVVAQFNSSPGLHAKHQLDADKERTILNIIIGTSKDRVGRLPTNSNPVLLHVCIVLSFWVLCRPPGRKRERL